MLLEFDERGEGPTIGLLHGFTQTGRSWGSIADKLAADHRVLALDAPGHGRSADLHLDLVQAGRAINATCPDADLVGYSMGGRMALHAAIEQPDAVRRLVLIGATAGIADPAERLERRCADEALADRIEAGGNEGLEDFLRSWLAGPLFAELSDEAADLPARLENTAEGLASSLRLCGTGAQEPLDARLQLISAPALLVVGEQDHKFRTEAERLEAGLANAEIAVIRGAGHACHLQHPDEFMRVVRRWLAG